MENPTTPLSHHNQDSTHISYDVLTLGLSTSTVTLEGSAFHPFHGHVLALRTGLALAAGDRKAASSALRAYIEGDTRSPLLAGAEVLAARRLLGTLLGGDEGDAMRSHADAALCAMGVVDLERSTQVLLPGCFLD